MYMFKDAEAVGKFITDAIQASSHENTIIGAYQGRCRLYDMGTQWISSQLTQAQTMRLDRQLSNYVPDRAPIRATINRITKHIRGVAASTKPRMMEFDAVPDASAPGPGEFHVASIVESAGNAMSMMAGLIGAAQRANNERTVGGMHGLGLMIENPAVTLDGQPVTDARIKAFDFDVTRLSLDPANNSNDLRDHDYVLYTDVWTVHKIKRVLGEGALLGVDEEKMQTVGTLMPMEMRYYSVSGGSMYWQYAAHSKTKGARVHMLFCRHPSGRFDRLYHAVELPTKVDKGGSPVRVINFDNPENPWGGTGMPMVLLMGHFRPGTRHAISDVGMMIDDQDKLNLLASIWFQSLYNYTGRAHWIADKRWFGTKMDNQQIEQALRQSVIVGDMGGGAETYKFRPKLETYPAPDMNIEALTRAYAEDIREQSFRTEQDVGRLKSHVTTPQLTMTNEAARQVLDDRTADDMSKYEQLGDVLAATGLRQTLLMRPTIIAQMQRSGLTVEDFVTVQQIDPDKPGAAIKMRSNSLRHRSREQRQQDLQIAVQMQAIDPVTYRRTLAGELGLPLTELDRDVVEYAKRQARRVMAGQPLDLVSLGPAHLPMLLDELTKAMVSRQAEQVQGATERLSDAVQEVQLMMAPPEQAGEQEPGPTESVSLADLAPSFEAVA